MNVSAPILDARGIGVAFPTPRGLVRAVEDVSLRIHPGETLGVVGESGSGKSVLLRALLGLLPPHARVRGEAVFDGVDLFDPALDTTRLLGDRLAMVFQNPLRSLHPVRTIGSQLSDTLRRHGGLSRRAARERAVELLISVGIPDPRRRVDQYPHELSGGMRQRVAIAVAISCSPALLIADEPTTALDVTVQRQILDLLDRLQDEHGMAMVLITHDLGVVAGRADRVAVMYAGGFVESASTAEYFTEVHHPYSAALLGAHPRLDAPGETLATVPGQPPDLVSPPPGCRFAPRCPNRQPVCETDRPALTVDGDGRLLACHLPVRVSDTAFRTRGPRTPSEAVEAAS